MLRRGDGPDGGAGGRIVITGDDVPEVWRSLWGEDYVERQWLEDEDDDANDDLHTRHVSSQCTVADNAASCTLKMSKKCCRQLVKTSQRVVRVVVIGGEEAADCLRDEARRVTEETPPFVLSVDIDYFSGEVACTHPSAFCIHSVVCCVLSA